MAATTNQTSRIERNKLTHAHMTIPFEEVTEPGTYYCRDTGWLYRMPEESLANGHSPLVNIVSKDEIFVTKISDNPWIPLGKAREICSNLDLEVNF